MFIKLLLDLTVMKVIRLQQKMKLGQSKINKTQAPYAIIWFPQETSVMGLELRQHSLF